MRYEARPEAHTASADDHVGVTADQVIVEDDAPRFSGLYDRHGRRLYRVPERVPLGFHHRS